MDDRKPAPDELRRLVDESLPPRAAIEVDWLDFDYREWRFRVRWFGRIFVLRIPGDHWSDRLLELISICAAFGAPRPEATVKGKRLNLSLERYVPGDSTRYKFSIFQKPADEPQVSTVVVTGSVAGMLMSRCGKHEEKAFELAVALWLFKDLVDQETLGEDFVVNSSKVESILNRPSLSDRQIRDYAGLKTYQTYQVAGSAAPVQFSWVDFGYLGVSEDDFSRAVRLREGRDWLVDGLTLTPTEDLLERLDEGSPLKERGLRAGPFPTKRETKDLFVSYASEDKRTLVRPLVQALTERGISVWFDEYELVLGDSLREKIDDGLRNSRHGLVVLSHSFFRRDWPKKELDGLFSLMDRDRRIMPVWHELTSEELTQYSPLLAGIVGIKSSEGIEKIVEAIERALGRAEA